MSLLLEQNWFYICKIPRFGSDVTRAILKCEGKGGVQYGTLQPQSLEKLKNLEKGI